MQGNLDKAHHPPKTGCGLCMQGEHCLNLGGREAGCLSYFHHCSCCTAHKAPRAVGSKKAEGKTGQLGGAPATCPPPPPNLQLLLKVAVQFQAEPANLHAQLHQPHASTKHRAADFKPCMPYVLPCRRAPSRQRQHAAAAATVRLPPTLAWRQRWTNTTTEAAAISTTAKHIQTATRQPQEVCAQERPAAHAHKQTQIQRRHQILRHGKRNTSPRIPSPGKHSTGHTKRKILELGKHKAPVRY